MYRFNPQLNGRWINGFQQVYADLLLATESACHKLNQLDPNMKARRETLLRGILGHIGNGFTIHSPFHCDFGCNISIGDNFVANYNLTILDEAQVTIGDNVFIGPNVGIYTIDHALDAGQRNRGIMRGRPVTIESDVWIGANAVILPGVTIGHHAVIGAGSVVTRDIPARMLALGNPCRPVRPITSDDIVTEE